MNNFKLEISKQLLAEIEAIQRDFLLEIKKIEGRRDEKIKKILEKKDKEDLETALVKLKKS